MTRLGALYDWLVAGKARTAAAAGGGDAWDFRRRRLPREELLVWTKAIDNSRVALQVDRKDWLASMGMAVGVIASSVALIALLVPGGVILLSNHRIEQMRRERAAMVNELRELRGAEAALKSPQNLERWSENYVTPSARAMVYAPAAKETVAVLKAQ